MAFMLTVVPCSHPACTRIARGRAKQVNKGVDSSILLRDVINGNPVESHIPLYSPLIKSIEVRAVISVFPHTVGMLSYQPCFGRTGELCKYARLFSSHHSGGMLGTSGLPMMHRVPCSPLCRRWRQVTTPASVGYFAVDTVVYFARHLFHLFPSGDGGGLHLPGEVKGQACATGAHLLHSQLGSEILPNYRWWWFRKLTLKINLGLADWWLELRMHFQSRRGVCTRTTYVPNMLLEGSYHTVRWV